MQDIPVQGSTLKRHLIPDESELNPANPYSRPSSPDIRHPSSPQHKKFDSLTSPIRHVLTEYQEFKEHNGKGKGRATFDQGQKRDWFYFPRVLVRSITAALPTIRNRGKWKRGSISPKLVNHKSARRKHSTILDGGMDSLPSSERLFPLSTLLCCTLFLGSIILIYLFISLNQSLRNAVQSELTTYSYTHHHHPPLSGCFDPDRVAKTDYNLTLHYDNKKRHTLNAGTNMKYEMECFDYSATIQPDTYDLEDSTPIIYHTYWRADLLPFQKRQYFTIISFLATQRLSRSRLIIWTNDLPSLMANEYVVKLHSQHPTIISVEQFDHASLARGTELEGLSALESMYDGLAWVDGDAVRLLALWHYGGIWFDMDEILTRDLGILAEHEFVTRWDCRDDPNLQLNGHIMHFKKHSPYLCEAFHIMSTEPDPGPNTLDWGAFLYQKLYRRILAQGIKPFSVLPWCFTDPRNCQRQNRFPDPFEWDPETWLGLPWQLPIHEAGRSGKHELDRRIAQIWSIHLHNQWDKVFPKGGYIDRLLHSYEHKVADQIRKRV